MVFRIVLLLLSVLSVGTSTASQRVFFPLPIQDNGKVLVGKQLYQSQQGGLWLLDMQHRVKFFDGIEVLPKVGSALNYTPSQLTYQQNAFWAYAGNEVYKIKPAQEREPVFSLTPGSDINQIGSSQGYIWVTDQEAFYAYHILTQKITRFALTRLYQYNPTALIRVQDAQFIDSRWVIATNSGVYLSEGKGFSHINSSKKTHVTTLYYSAHRRELVLASDNVVQFVDVDNPSLPPSRRVVKGQVTAITETEDSYWIGTDSGLYIVPFFAQPDEYLDGLGIHEFNLQGQHIYALLNDQKGGIWVSTENGIQYHSLYGEQFERQFQPIHDLNNQLLRFQSIHLAKSHQHYWILSQTGLYRFSETPGAKAQLVYQGTVTDFVETAKHLWLATDKGIVVLDSNTGNPEPFDLPGYLTSTPMTQLEANNQQQLWGVSQGELWRYDLSTRQLKRFSNHWLNHQSMPESHWNLFVLKNNHLVLSTGNRLYAINGETISVVGEAQFSGRVFDFIEVSPNVVWGNTAYGIFSYDTKQRIYQELRLPIEGVTPKCLSQNQDGIWLSSSLGLTHYQANGTLVRHYSAPYGLIYNEFLPSFCSSLANDKRGVLLGSKYGLVMINTYPLMTNSAPKPNLMVSQVTINQVNWSVGGDTLPPLRFEHGDTMSVRFGASPMLSNPELEYRLSREHQWQPLAGSQLTFSRLSPGDYQLMVRHRMPNDQIVQALPLEFVVGEPWFLSRYAVVGYMLSLLVMVALFLWWRIHLAAQNRRFLQAQVGLKTEQFRHQTRALLAANHQLRKQLQLRRVIFSKVLERMKKRLTKQALRASTIKDQHHLVEQIYAELDLLENVRSDKTGSQAVFNLEVVLKSALDVWREEFERHELSIVYTKVDEQALFIEVFEFNLDEVFSAVFNNLLRRCYRKQQVSLSVELRDHRAIVACYDQGQEITVSDTTLTDWNIVKHHVQQSGGQMAIFSSSERNLIELSWPNHQVFDEFDVTEEASQSLDESAPNLSFEPWLKKLEELVQEQFSDPEFSTTSAAKLMYVSERSLQRRFKQLTGRTFKDYLNEVRLEHACCQLLEGEKVSDVAFACGFNDPSYFSQRFKAYFGASPTQFIESQETL